MDLFEYIGHVGLLKSQILVVGPTEANTANKSN